MESLVLLKLMAAFLGANLWSSGQGASAACSEDFFTSGRLRVQVSRLTSGQCLASVAQMTSGDSARSYFFSSQGLFLVTESMERDWQVESGSRAMFLLPRSGELTVHLSHDGEVQIQTPSHLMFRFSPETARLLEVEGAEYFEDPLISMSNYGGVEINRVKEGLLLDSGWVRDGVAFHQPERQSLFRDSGNRYCAVSNREIFNYESRTVQMKHSFDRDLFQFLAERCPELRVDPR